MSPSSCDIYDKNEDSFHPSEFVRAVRTEDGAALLDIHQGLCFSLNAVGLRMWDLLNHDYSGRDLIADLCRQFGDVDQSVIKTDLAEFIANLQKLGLFVKEKASPRLPWCDRRLLKWQQKRANTTQTDRQLIQFLTLKAFSALLAFDLLRLGQSFPRIYRFVQGWRVANAAAATGTVELICTAVNRASVWYPKRVLCLQRSIVTTCLLRSYGVPAQVVLGAQKLPFKAHAWVEVEGIVINEQQDVRSIYMVWDHC